MSKSFHKGSEFANVKETWEQNEKAGTGEVMPANREPSQEPLGSDFWQKEKEEVASGERESEDKE